MKNTTLKEIENNTELTSKAHDPQKYFQNKKGLYVWSGFTANILPNAKKTNANKQFKLSSFELVKSATDESIENSLPEKHIFSETEVCAVIAALIEKQPEGEEGLLLNNGYANLFYTPSHVVGVGWLSDDREWYVLGWGRGDGGWGGGLRVFSHATDSSTSALGSSSLKLDTSIEEAIETVKKAGYKVMKEI